MNPLAEYREVIRIEEPVKAQDPVTGEVTVLWSTVYAEVPCSIKPFSVRDYLQAQSVQSESSVRVTFHWLDGVTNEVRFVGLTGSYRDRIFNPEGALEDAIDGRTYVTYPCKQGVNEGDA